MVYMIYYTKHMYKIYLVCISNMYIYIYIYIIYLISYIIYHIYIYIDMYMCDIFTIRKQNIELYIYTLQICIYKKSAPSLPFPLVSPSGFVTVKAVAQGFRCPSDRCSSTRGFPRRFGELVLSIKLMFWELERRNFRECCKSCDPPTYFIVFHKKDECHRLCFS